MRLVHAVAALVVAAATLPCLAAEQDEAARLMAELMSGKTAVGTSFTLPDTSGASRSLADFRGKLVLLYFGYLTCPDVCPTDLAHIAAALHALGADADRVQPLFVTIDPARDTPRRLAAYVNAFDPRFVALRGTDGETLRIARAFKVYYEKSPDGSISHAAFTFLLDRDGRYVAFFPPGTPGARMAQMLREQLMIPAAIR